MDKMKVSYCILTYNQEDYIEETIKAAFDQTYSPMEIIISDDGSTDSTYDIIKRVVRQYQGPNRVIVNQNKPNLGLREHYNKVLYELSHGDIIILADGDDVSIETRVSDYVEMFERFPEVVMISSKSIETDCHLQPLKTEDEWDGSFSINTINDYIDDKTWFNHSSDSRGLRRSVVDAFPPLKYPKAEDMSFFIRALMVGSECYIRKGYIFRRHHDENASSSKWTNELSTRLKKQMSEDVDLALEKELITEKKAVAIKDKFNYAMKYIYLYGKNTSVSLISLPYRVLSKVLKLRIFRV